MNNNEKMNGQWIGSFTDLGKGGHIHVNIDETESNYRGVAYLWPFDPQFPPAAAHFTTQDKQREFRSAPRRSKRSTVTRPTLSRGKQSELSTPKARLSPSTLTFAAHSTEIR